MSKEQPIWGIDISHWQQGLDMERVKAEGYEFAVIKATEGPYQDGSRYTDPSYQTHLENAKAAGLIIGAYHFLVETPPKAQVDHFLDVAGDVSGKIVMVDFEEYPSPHQYLTPYNATLKGFVAELRRRIGDHPTIIYSGRGFWNGGEPTGPVSQFGDVTTWDAYYLTMAPVDPKPFYEDMKEHGWGEPWGNQQPMFWQFTSAGRVAGLNLDVNAFRGTREQLLALTRGGGITTTPAPAPTPAPEKEIVLKTGLGKDGDASVQYVWEHPTNYNWRRDIETLTHKLVNMPEFRGKIWINTYMFHPPGWNRDTTSFDVWGFGGRGHPLPPEIGQRVFDAIFNDPNPPDIWWTIYRGRMWTRIGGWGPSPPGPPDSDPRHDRHIHVTYLDD